MKEEFDIFMQIFLYLFIFTLGVLIGMLLMERDHIKEELEKKREEYKIKQPPLDDEGYSDEEKTSWYKIVRYKNGEFDCIWDSIIYDKRVADKRCKKLNDPKSSESKYGKYVVEPG